MKSPCDVITITPCVVSFDATYILPYLSTTQDTGEYPSFSPKSSDSGFPISLTNEPSAKSNTTSL